MTATKAQRIPQGGSLGAGRALQRCLKMKQRMRRQSLCTLAFDEGCLWREEFKIPSTQGRSRAGPAASPSAGNSLESWGKENGLILRGALEGTPQHPLYNTATALSLMRAVFKNSFLNNTHLHGFYCVLSSCIL